MSGTSICGDVVLISDKESFNQCREDGTQGEMGDKEVRKVG